MLKTLRHNIRNLTFLAFVLLFVLTTCTAPKGPLLSGRILSFNPNVCRVDEQFSILEYEVGMGSSFTPLWTALPCNFSTGVIVSPDRHFAMFISDLPHVELLLFDLTSGEYKYLTLPEIHSRDFHSRGAFSPNDRYFAYAENGYILSISRLHLLDLATGKDSILFESSHANYSSPGMAFSSTSVYADIGNPQWIDETTLVFSGYSGDMPVATKFGAHVDPNHTFVMDVDGTSVKFLDQHCSILNMEKKMKDINGWKPQN
jgi:hypothetical protein